MRASDDLHSKATLMSAAGIRSDATFSPSDYRKSIAEMFGVLDASQQHDLVDKLALLPRHIHRLAADGLIAGPSGQRC